MKTNRLIQLVAAVLTFFTLLTISVSPVYGGSKDGGGGIKINGRIYPPLEAGFLLDRLISDVI